MCEQEHVRALDVNPQMQVVGVFLGEREEGRSMDLRNRGFLPHIMRDRRDLITGLRIIELSR